jgi:hypothetical protein
MIASGSIPDCGWIPVEMAAAIRYHSTVITGCGKLIGPLLFLLQQMFSEMTAIIAAVPGASLPVPAGLYVPARTR